MKFERGFVMNGSSSHYLDGFVSRSSNGNGYDCATISMSSSPSSSSSNSSPMSPGINNYIEHRVSKMDTLAGVAIKYGVEVADIRRMNGLVSDLHMFARKSLQIPLPGRHPPSPVLSNGSVCNGEQTPPPRPHGDVLHSFQSLKMKPPHEVSSAMSSLQGFYCLPPHKTGAVMEGTEMAIYKTRRVLCLEDAVLSRESPVYDTVFSRHRKSRSLVSLQNGDLATKVVEAGDGSESNRSIRRRQKVETDTSVQTPEILLKEDNCGGGFSGRTGNGLALRPKMGSRADMDAGRQNIPIIDSLMADVFFSVRKSSSTSNLQETETASSSLWPTGKWSDAIARPIFDGLPKPMNVRTNKAALD